MKEKFSKSGIIFVALAVPLGLLASTVAMLALKSINPDKIDITAELAYLSQSLYVGYGITIVLLLIGAIASFVGLRRGHKTLAKTTLVTLAIIALCVLGAAFAHRQTANVESSYAKEQLKTLFQQLKLPTSGQ